MPHVKKLLADPNTDLDREVGQILGNAISRRPDRIIPHFRGFLKDVRTSRWATEALGKAARRNARRLMPHLDRLMSDKDRHVRLNAMDAFEKYVTTHPEARKHMKRYYLEKDRKRQNR